MKKGQSIARGLSDWLAEQTEEVQQAAKILLDRGVGIAHLQRALKAKPRGRPRTWFKEDYEAIAEAHRLGVKILERRGIRADAITDKKALEAYAKTWFPALRLTERDIGEWATAWAKRLSEHRKSNP